MQPDPRRMTQSITVSAALSFSLFLAIAKYAKSRGWINSFSSALATALTSALRVALQQLLLSSV
jgi:hypothetical protein